jgi:arsenate reductase (thioredoxin)
LSNRQEAPLALEYLMGRVLFICEGNVGRSPMAEAIFEREADGRHEARSAGTRPSSSPSPLVEEAMLEIGIDLAGRRSRKLGAEDIEWADLVVIAGETRGLPDLSEKQVVVWDLPRIKHEPLEVVRRARDEIRHLAFKAIHELDCKV